MLCDIGLHRVDPATVWNGGVGFSRCLRCRCEMVRRGHARWTSVPRGYAVVWRPDGPASDATTGVDMQSRPSLSDSARNPAIGPEKSLVDLASEMEGSAAFRLPDAGSEARVRLMADGEARVNTILPDRPTAFPQSARRRLIAAAASARRSAGWMRRAVSRSLTVIEPPREQASRTYRYMVRRIAATMGGDARSVLVSAACAMDPANETVLLLSAMMQDELGGRVLLIDATLRDGGIGALLGAQGQPGLSEARADDLQSLAALIRPLHRQSLFLLGAGLVPAASRAADMAGIVSTLAQDFDHIVIQQQAITADTRYLAMAGQADLVLLLAEEGRSRMADLTLCRDTFHANGIDNVGLILTVPPAATDGPVNAGVMAA